jgi:hypothetical protein
MQASGEIGASLLEGVCGAAGVASQEFMARGLSLCIIKIYKKNNYKYVKSNG